VFLRQCGRKAQRGTEPNDRRHSRHVEKALKHLKPEELDSLILTVHQNKEDGKFSHSQIAGCMGMASLTENKIRIREEFNFLRSVFEKIKIAFPADPVNTLSMGMSSDYPIAIEAGSTMVRIGSLLFGKR